MGAGIQSAHGGPAPACLAQTTELPSAGCKPVLGPPPLALQGVRRLITVSGSFATTIASLLLLPPAHISTCPAAPSASQMLQERLAAVWIVREDRDQKLPSLP